MIQKPPFSSTPGQLETTDLAAEEFPSGGAFDRPEVVETTRTVVVVRKSKLTEDEIRLGEEAFLNALIELEALGKTAADGENERAEKERQRRSKINDFRQTLEQRIEEHNTRRATQEQVAEQQTEGLGTHPAQGAEEKYERTEEEGHPHGDDSSQTTLLAESPTGETDFSEVASQTLLMGADPLWDDPAVFVAEQPAETAIEIWSEDSIIPADVVGQFDGDSSAERCLGLSDLARLGGENALDIIAQGFDEQSEDVRNAAARALFDFQQDRAASFAQTLREGSPERRRRIGTALATSGLADIAIGNLAGQGREQSYEAFSLLFLMTKAGEVQPLLRAVEDHPSIEVRLTVVKLLTLNAQAEIVPLLRRLAVCGILPSEVRAAVIEAIYELSRQIPRQLSSRREGIENRTSL